MQAESAFWDFVKIALGAGFMYLSYAIGKAVGSVKSTPSWQKYVGALGVAAFIGVGAAAQLGTHAEDADPLFGGGERVIDRVPTKKQRQHHGWLVFLLIAAPAVVGIHKGQQPDGSS